MKKIQIFTIFVSLFLISCTSVDNYLSDFKDKIKNADDPNFSKITCQEAFAGLSHKTKTMVNIQDFYAENLYGKRVGWDLKFAEAKYDRSNFRDSQHATNSDDNFLLSFACPNGIVTVRYMGGTDGVKMLKKGHVYRLYAYITGVDTTLRDNDYTILNLKSERGILEIENPELYKKYSLKAQ